MIARGRDRGNGYASRRTLVSQSAMRASHRPVDDVVLPAGDVQGRLHEGIWVRALRLAVQQRCKDC
jgi:hypothetical protein